MLRTTCSRTPTATGPGLLQQMCDAAGIVVDKDFDIENYYRTLGAMFPREFEFLASMPQVIETESYIFVHGGLPKGDPGHWDGWDCMKNDDFMGQGRKFDKWVIVGHWPVQLYGGDVCCANPIIDRDSHIISIDGGCVLKDDGQLNALVIPHDGSDDFGLIAYDPFPVRRVKSAQAGGGPSTYIRWGRQSGRNTQQGRGVFPCAACAHGIRARHPDKIPVRRERRGPLQRLQPTTSCRLRPETRSA